MNAQLDPNFSSLKGHFLIATPVINDGFFCRSLTYMCEHNASGAMGIVVNQVLDMDLSEVLAHLKIESLPQLKTKNPYWRVVRFKWTTVLFYIVASQSGRKVIG